MGINFKNCLGLAAGFDKNGDYIEVFDAMGFGFIEVGTVTPKAQFGNYQPRLFRLIEVEGIINRMGFNNLGVDYLVENIKKTNFTGVLGINISKNKDTTIENSIEDYLICLEKVYNFSSYVTVNISSPNTPGLRNLQYGELLNNLLEDLKSKQKFLEKKYLKYVPLLIKISPDITELELIQICDSLLRNKIDGIIATNSSIDRSSIKKIKFSKETGGLSGLPIQRKSTEIIYSLSKELKGKLPIIGVGGINSVISAREKLIAGASLLQIYSGLVYQGPRLIRNIINNC